MNGDWLTKREFANYAGWTERYVEKHAAAGDIRTRPTGRNGRNGKPALEYAARSLPPEGQRKLLDRGFAAMVHVPSTTVSSESQGSLFNARRTEDEEEERILGRAGETAGGGAAV